MRTRLLFPIAVSLVYLAGRTSAQTPRAALHTFIIEHPVPVAGAEFGFHVEICDATGDGIPDLAVGAPGEDAVYLMVGPQFDSHVRIDGPQGRFGHSVAAADLDQDGMDEIIIGVPERAEVFIWNQGIMTSTSVAGAQYLGRDVAAGDFDQDGSIDVVAGDPWAENVIVWYGNGIRQVVMNPAGDGNFGHSLAIMDVNHDSIDDLVVSAPGNDTSYGVVLGGQVYVFHGPGLTTATLFEPAAAVPGDNARYGMHVSARGRVLAVGTPREDAGGNWDQGVGRVYSAGQTYLFHSPVPQVEALFSFRVLVGDFVEDYHYDVAFIALSAPPAQGIYIFSELTGNMEFISIKQRSADHFAQGLDAGQLMRGGKEEIVLGGPSYDGIFNNEGRIVVYVR